MLERGANFGKLSTELRGSSQSLRELDRRTWQPALSRAALVSSTEIAGERGRQFGRVFLTGRPK